MSARFGSGRGARWARMAGVAASAAALAAAGVVFVGGARAGGVPASGALVYSGQLTRTDGAPVDGSQNVGLAFYAAATGGDALCRVESAPVAVTTGRFQIPLPDGCALAVQDHAELWIGVQVGGTQLGRAKIGAVPYALEAGRASALVDALARRLVPAGAVMHFALPQCPPGWSDFAPARGRYLVGVPDGGALGETVGQALDDREERPVGRHAHAVNDPGHTHGNNGKTGGAGSTDVSFAGRDPGEDERGDCARVVISNYLGCGDRWTGHVHDVPRGPTGVTVSDFGEVPGTNAPYVQLRACKKD